MNHPSREDWMSYLYDELPPARRVDYQAHLGVCPECKQAVEDWRGTLARLDTWKLPAAGPKRQPVIQVMRWAAAAAVILGAGFFFGRLAGPPAMDPAALRAEIVPALRAELKQEFAVQLRQAVDASHSETKQALETLVSVWTEARQQDQQNTLALLQRAEQNRQMDFALLRRDLETVALVGETGLRSTRNQLARLASLEAGGGAGPNFLPEEPNQPHP